MRTLPIVLLVACSTPLPVGHVVDDVSAPVPFTTEQLRAHNIVGHTMVFRVDSTSASPMRRTMRFAEVDDEGAWIESTVGAWEDDPSLVDTTRSYSTWAELQRHAAYPAEWTTRTWSKVTLPEGTVRCVLYTVTESEDRSTEACFDLDRPGPPVHMLQRVGDEPQFSMTLQSVQATEPSGAP